ncbi:MAG: CAP domain-containing protein [Bacteroidota bacterium]
MFHVKHVLFISLLFISFFARSQGTVSMRDIIITYPLAEDAALRKALNDWPGYKALGKEEKEITYYLNYARQNPSLFLKNAINVFMANHPETKSSYTKSLQKTFEGLAPMPIIFPDAAFSTVSEAHAADLSSHNIISHRSTDGRSFQDRVQDYIKGCGSESIHASPRFNALEAILNLLFDFNVPDLGHRKSLLDTRFHKGGFGVSHGSKGNTIVVIDFSCQ